MEFTTGERTLVELKRILRVSDDVLRHMVVKPRRATRTSHSLTHRSYGLTPRR